MTYRAEFETFGQFAAAVVRAGIDRNIVDPRLTFAAGPTGLNEGLGNTGGFLVPDVWTEGLWERVYSTGSIVSRCDRQPITRGNSLKIPAVAETNRADGSRYGGIHLYWGDEADPATASKPTLQLMRMQVKKLLGLCYVTDDLLQDAPALEAALRRMFSTEAVLIIEDQIINGIGGARPLGILNSSALITVAKESGQAAATIVKANINAMHARLPVASRKTAVWLVHTDTEPQLEKLNDSGDPNIHTAPANGEWFARLKGCPVIPTDYNPALGTSGDIILADLSAYLIGEREPEIISSIHVKYIESETAFRFTFRFDGQPGWLTPVQRRNSSVTESPFITLAARA